jgi:hypothetical protein
VRAYIAYALALALLAAAAVQPAAALNEIGIPFVTSCGFVYMMPFSNTGVTIVEFNDARSSLVDFETLDIDFPAFGRDDNGILDLGPTLLNADDLSASANVLPFGPVNLAFPSIDQAVFQKSDYERTYFFVDFLSG